MLIFSVSFQFYRMIPRCLGFKDLGAWGFKAGARPHHHRIDTDVAHERRRFRFRVWELGFRADGDIRVWDLGFRADGGVRVWDLRFQGGCWVGETPDSTAAKKKYSRTPLNSQDPYRGGKLEKYAPQGFSPVSTLLLFLL